MAFELADWIGMDDVVGDSAEGNNPMHDVCRIIVGGAVELATRLRGRPIGNYEWSVRDMNAPSRTFRPLQTAPGLVDG